LGDYSYAEIGMLAGAALGGALAVIGFSIWNNALFFACAGLGVGLGIFVGRKIDRIKVRQKDFKNFLHKKDEGI